MIKQIKYQLKCLLPVESLSESSTNDRSKQFLTLSLKRSGQHAIINWLCYQLGDVAHLNHCSFERSGMRNIITPINNRLITYRGVKKHDTGIQSDLPSSIFKSSDWPYKNTLHSFENTDLENKLIKKYARKYDTKVVLIMRDPYNWLASTMKRKNNTEAELKEKVGMLKKYLEQALSIRNYLGRDMVAINYNRWSSQTEYREEICENMGIVFSSIADESVNEIPNFGGGSSFTGIAMDCKDSAEGYENRWKEFVNDSLYRELLEDEYLVHVSNLFFEIKKPF